MRSDFANRSARKPGKSSSKGSTKRQNKQTGRGGNKPPRRFFHGPSFSGGIILGALLVLGGAYLPDLLPKLIATTDNQTLAAAEADATADVATSAEPAVEFRFDSMLRNSEVQADASFYTPAEPAPGEAKEFLLQAASFRSEKEADELRAQLLLMDLPAATDMVALSSGRWFRVTVGPFASRTEAQRALTTLRGKNISPLWIKRDAA